MCWVLANCKSGQVFDYTKFSTAMKALDYRDKHYPAFKSLLKLINF